jgi:hypothetical protein
MKNALTAWGRGALGHGGDVGRRRSGPILNQARNRPLRGEFIEHVNKERKFENVRN